MPDVTSARILPVISEKLGVDANHPFYTEFEAVRLAAILRELPCVTGKARVLDFGYLMGMLPKVILNFYPADYIVYDHPRAPVFQDANEMATASNLGVQLYACDLADLTGLRESLGKIEPFDAVIMGEIVEHLNPTLVADILAILAKSLKPGGRIVITTPNLFGIANVARHLIGKDVQEIPLGHEIMIQGHIHLWSPTMMSALLKASGLQPLQPYYYHGLEGTQYALSNRTWGSLGYQCWHKVLHFLALIRRPWRGFFVLAGEKPIL